MLHFTVVNSMHIVVQQTLEVFHLAWLNLYIHQTIPISFSIQPFVTPFYALLLWVWLLKIPRVSGIMQYLSVCDWLILLSKMYSSFIHVIAHDRVSYFFRLNTIPLHVYSMFSLSIYPLIDIRNSWNSPVRKQPSSKWAKHLNRHLTK